MKKKSQFEFTRVLKLPPALGDWTTIQYHDPDEDVSIAPVVNINFDSFPKESLKKAHILHYKFADRLVQKFSKDLNLKVELHTISASQMPYGDFLNTQENKVVQADFVIPNLGRMNLIVEWELADAIIDRVTGGKGEETENRQFSDIELHMLHTMLLETLPHYAYAWSYVLKPEEIAMEFVSGRYRRDRKLTLREAYVVFSFYIHLGKGSVKKISCAYPNVVLRRLMQLHQKTAIQSNPMIKLAPKTLKGINVELVAILGHAELTMRELSQLREGDIIPLDSSLDSPIEIQLGSENAFYAQPGISKERLSAQLLVWDGVSDPGALVRPSTDAGLAAYAQAPLVEHDDPFSASPEPVRLLESNEHLSIPVPLPVMPPPAPKYEPLDLDDYQDPAEEEEESLPQPALEDDENEWDDDSDSSSDEDDDVEDDIEDDDDEEQEEDEDDFAAPAPSTSEAQKNTEAAPAATSDDDDYSWDDLEDEF